MTSIIPCFFDAIPGIFASKVSDWIGTNVTCTHLGISWEAPATWHGCLRVYFIGYFLFHSKLFSGGLSFSISWPSRGPPNCSKSHYSTYYQSEDLKLVQLDLTSSHHGWGRRCGFSLSLLSPRRATQLHFPPPCPLSCNPPIIFSVSPPSCTCHCPPCPLPNVVTMSPRHVPDPPMSRLPQFPIQFIQLQCLLHDFFPDPVDPRFSYADIEYPHSMLYVI